MIKAVLWDIDGTLLDFLLSEKVAISACFQKFGLGQCTDSMIKQYSAINVGFWKKLERGEMTKAEILVGRFAEFFSQIGIDPSIAPAFNAEYQIRLGDTACFQKNAFETVKALQGKVMQCAVTNGTRIAQERKLALCGLDKILDQVFISEIVGFEKPNPCFFDQVFKWINSAAINTSSKKSSIKPSQMLIVGDSLTSDILGGVNAGIKTCWFNPTGVKNPQPVPDYEISDLSQVLDIVN
ncbi:MAG: YjjG family noncanonical pyrimidine nucleotidase [Treponema sp.]|nr:YjjG family noncanonical pyrimidine nucleotidase [Treponema sp.]